MAEDKGEVRDKTAKSEEELAAMAIFGVAQPEADWEAIGQPIREPYFKMAQAAVAAAMPPLPEHQGTPPYPAELLDELAIVLALVSVGKIELGPGHERGLQALDRYSQEVGRENVPSEVDYAIGELGG